MERVIDQSLGVPIICYDHEPRSRGQLPEVMESILLQRPQQLFNSETTSLSGKDDAKENLPPIFIGNEGPSVVVKLTVCVIAFIVMVICLCFLFV
ncbi:hypothetical protein LOAG_08478 [Loa loa]|uniref:Ovule protein n=1 Tax=Loa loa TaxID=7209 RepID=A0A1I7VAR5_LOALO|nr:hypothetical protein LOAG_08478 [Loa loa]EFO20015.1 hypothetical protein LOAG_08478 [Loa loa]